MRFTFCPACATILEPAEDDPGMHCPGCGRSWYDNPAPTAGCVIVRDEKVLLTKRARPPEKGRYDIPGGFLDRGEDPLEGLRRELREELGVEIDVEPSGLLGGSPHIYGEDQWVVSFAFKARLKSGEPKPADDVAEVRWVSEGELEDIGFAWEHDRDLARKALQDERDRR